MRMTVYDVVIIGSGIACSMTLCQLVERLKGMPVRGRALRIGVIEKEGEMWNGIPYGSRSAIGALAFQRLQEFLEQPERSSYVDWLVENSASWLATLREWGGPGALKWISDNQSLMDRGEWEELYLPRFVFGLYVSARAARAVEELSKAGLGSVTLVHGEATEISRMPCRPHLIVVEHSGGARLPLYATRVVLAIGSPPQKSMHAAGLAVRQSHTHIGDIYSPCEDVSIEAIRQALSSVATTEMANMLILGSNASALEVLYLLNYRPEIRKLINSVVVLSRSGLLPYRICGEIVPFKLTALEFLLGSGDVSAADLIAAIRADIKKAEDLRLNIADLRDPVGAAVGRLTAMMEISEQKRFVCEHGVHYSRMMRRAGPDTCNATDELVRAGILTTVKGEFRGLVSCAAGNGLMLAAYASSEGGGEITHPVPFRITINCGGFEELDGASSRLINSLIVNGLCRVNSTHRGFVVNDRLEASEDLYVIGPLLAGNFNNTVRLWHVESASRIAGLARLLAKSLSDSIYPPSKVTLPDTNGLASSVASSVFPPYV